MGDDLFSYVDGVKQECETHGCEEDLLIISGGVAELLNSTFLRNSSFLDSFTGVR